MAKTMACLQAFPSSLLPRARSRALIPFPFPFECLPTFERLPTFRVELVTSHNRDYRPYAMSEHSFFVFHGEFTNGFVQGKPNIDEYV